MACARVSWLSGRCCKATSACSMYVTASRWADCAMVFLAGLSAIHQAFPTPPPGRNGAPARCNAPPFGPDTVPHWPSPQPGAGYLALYQEALVGDILDHGVLEDVGELYYEPCS